MKNYLMAVTACALLCAGGPAAAKASGSAAPFKLAVLGEGRWSVRCESETSGGIIDRQELRSDKGWKREFASDKFTRVSCDYRATADKPLTIAIEGDAWTCPLQAPTGTKCEQTLATGGSGNFRTVRRIER